MAGFCFSENFRYFIADMNIGILIASQLFEAYSGATRIEEAGKAAGHTMHRILERHISFEETGSGAAVSDVGAGFYAGPLKVKYDGKPMPEFDVIIVRPNFVEEPSQHQFIYDLLKQAGYKLVNGSAGVTRTKNKILQRADLRRENIPMPKWGVAYSVIGCESAVKEIGYPAVLKMAFGTRGKGVFFVEKRETLIPIVDYLNVRDGNPVIIEEFIEEAQRSHIRAFVVGDEIVASMEAIAPNGDIRSNAGGTYKSVQLTEEEKQMALKAAKTMQLEIAGVDIIRSKRGPLVLEVNANPGFSSLETATKIDIAKKIVEFSLTLVK